MARTGRQHKRAVDKPQGLPSGPPLAGVKPTEAVADAKDFPDCMGCQSVHELLDNAVQPRAEAPSVDDACICARAAPWEPQVKCMGGDSPKQP